MNQLEYYNISLNTAYPFAYANNGIPNNWFADIIIYTTTASAYFYLKNIITLAGGTNETLVSLEDDLNNTVTVVLPTSGIVDNTNINNVPFFTGVNPYRGIIAKVVLGPGFPSDSSVAIHVIGSANTTKLLSSCLVTLPPLVNTINWYTASSNTVSNLTTTSVEGTSATIDFRYNIVSSPTGVIDVNPGQGAGLYDACADIYPTSNVYEINKISPTSSGNLFLTTDQCYQTQVYSSSIDTIYGPQVISSIPRANLINHSLFIENNCTAKCTAAALDAFANYLNRIYNGAQDLYEFFGSPYQTAGVGSLTSGTSSFTASSFTSTYPAQTGFIPYFHEGKTITFASSAHPGGYTYTITAVTNSSTVTLSPTPAVNLTSANFTVNDLGIYEQLNEAIVTYNTGAGSTLNIPYGLIQYTTYNTTDAFGNFGTFISVVETIFNPSINNINFVVNVTATNAEVVNGIERVTIGSTTTYNTNTGTIGCKTYGTWENLYFIPCGATTGTLAISTTYAGGTALKNGARTITTTSCDCPPTITSASNVTIAAGSTFHYTVTATAPGILTLTGVPSWATVDTNVPPSTYSISGTSTDTSTAYYIIEMTLTNSSGAYSTFILYLNVLTPPVLSSTNQTIDLDTPFYYLVPSTNSPTSFASTGTLPPGIILNTTTGALSGTPTALGTYTQHISGTNVAGTGSTTFNISVVNITPVVTSATINAKQGSSFSYSIVAANYPTSYGATGLPSGVILNPSTGVIYGTPTSSGSFTIGISAINSAGTGTGTLTLVVAAEPPIITSSNYVVIYPSTSLKYVITASNNPTSYSATSLPSGLSITGNVISGFPAVGASTMQVSATNTTGTSYLYVAVNVISYGAGTSIPVINSPTSVTVAKGSYFTYYITASNSPTSYTVTGLPAWATLNNNGAITNHELGLIYGFPTIAGTYSGISITATNAIGTSTAFSLTITVV